MNSFSDYHGSTSTSNDVARARSLRKALKKRIIKDGREHTKPLNILLVGVAGVGKSSFLNSATTAALNERAEWVVTGGSGGTGRTNITVSLRRVNIFDPTSDDPQRLPRTPHNDDHWILLEMAPRFIDVCGLPNENNPVVQEVLRLLYHGHIPVNENVLEVHAYGVQKATEWGHRKAAAALRAKYPTPDPNLAIDRVVVINSADNDAPSELTRAVMETAQPLSTDTEGAGVASRKTVLQYLLVTKTDLLRHWEGDQTQQYEAMCKGMIRMLALVGSESSRIGHCANYISEDGADCMETNPDKDKKLLEFLLELCDRRLVNISSEGELPHVPAPNPLPPPYPPSRVLDSMTVHPLIGDRTPNSAVVPLPEWVILCLLVLAITCVLSILLFWGWEELFYSVIAFLGTRKLISYFF